MPCTIPKRQTLEEDSIIPDANYDSCSLGRINIEERAVEAIYQLSKKSRLVMVMCRV
jgi:hypothetical protein